MFIKTRMCHRFYAVMHAGARACDGVALIEFAFVFPFLFVLLFGAVELGRNILITERVEKAGYVLTDIVSQLPPATGEAQTGELTQAALDNGESGVFSIFNRIMGIYADPSRQRVIVTAVRKEAGQLRIKWQIAGGGTLGGNIESVVNGLAPDAINPAQIKDSIATFVGDVTAAQNLAVAAPGETLLVGEIFYDYQPILTFLLRGVTQVLPNAQTFFLQPRIIIKRMYFRPRGGDPICLPPAYRYDECTTTATAGVNCLYSSSQRRTDCATRSATRSDYYRCANAQVRELAGFASPSFAGCSGFAYGINLESFEDPALTGARR